MPSVAIRGMMFCNQGQTVNQNKRVWRPFHKPKWWDICKQTRYNTSTATDLFKGSLNVSQLIPATICVTLNSANFILSFRVTLICKFRILLTSYKELCKPFLVKFVLNFLTSQQS